MGLSTCTWSKTGAQEPALEELNKRNIVFLCVRDRNKPIRKSIIAQLPVRFYYVTLTTCHYEKHLSLVE